MRDLSPAAILRYRAQEIERVVAGRGRSAAVAMAWLLYRYKHLDLDKAQQLLLSKRAMVRGRLYKQRVLVAYYSEILEQRGQLVN